MKTWKKALVLALPLAPLPVAWLLFPLPSIEMDHTLFFQSIGLEALTCLFTFGLVSVWKKAWHASYCLPGSLGRTASLLPHCLSLSGLGACTVPHTPCCSPQDACTCSSTWRTRPSPFPFPQPADGRFSLAYKPSSLAVYVTGSASYCRFASSYTRKSYSSSIFS